MSRENYSNVNKDQFSLVDRWQKFEPMNILNDTMHLVPYKTVPNYTTIDCHGVIIPNTTEELLEPTASQMRSKENIHINSETKSSSRLSEFDDIVVFENRS